MTVRLRPGHYIALVLQRPNGDTRQGPWARESDSYPNWWLNFKDERPVYLVRCILREPQP